MTSLTAHGICNAIGGQLVSGPFERVASGGVCTDSRALAPHAVFFALGGEKFDGNLFAPEASRTAAAVVVSRVEPGIDPSCAVILVEDTLAALQKLASWWRSNLKLTVVGHRVQWENLHEGPDYRRPLPEIPHRRHGRQSEQPHRRPPQHPESGTRR